MAARPLALRTFFRLGFEDSACTKRLAAAVVASTLLHLLAANCLTGSGSRARTSPPSPPLTARLVEVESPTVPDAAPAPIDPRTEAPRPTRHRERRSAIEPSLAPTELPAGTPLPGTPSSASAVAEMPDVTYYGAKQLDVFPTLVSKLQLGSVALGAGRALLLVMIDAAGVVNEVSLVEASSASLPEEDVRRAFTSARFTPAYRNGRAVRSRMLIEVSYGGDRDGGS